MMPTNPADTIDATSTEMARQLLAEFGAAGPPDDSQDSVAMEIFEVVRNASGLPDAAERTRAVAKHLSNLMSPTTGNRLAEIYVRIWRFLASYKESIADSCEEDHRAPPGWFQRLDSYTFDEPIPSDDLALETMLFGLGLSVSRRFISVAVTWGDLIVGFWRKALATVLNAEAAHRMQESELLAELCEIYIRETEQSQVDIDAVLGRCTRKSDLERWWFKSQVRFNVPCGWLTWRPYLLIWGRTADGIWQCGHSEWDLAGMGPLTIRAYAEVIQRVWSTRGWSDLEVLSSGDYGKIGKKPSATTARRSDW